MKIIRARNVATALPLGVDYLLREGAEEASRAGPVLVAPGPVATIYARPQECVLFNAVRDANPFFTLLEAMWMLAGRNDAAFLNNYVKDFGERFAEPNGKIHDAYGRRWKSAFGFDQKWHIIRHLRDNPEDRQCVLQMWNSGYWENDQKGDWRTRPCNTHAYFRSVQDHPGTNDRVLDMMVCCRSNDIIWGAYSANACHFAMLQQYLAAMIGVGVGTYTQMSFNYHAYLTELRALARRADPGFSPEGEGLKSLPLALLGDAYANGDVAPVSLVEDPASFDRELEACMDTLEYIHDADWDALCAMDSGEFRYRNPFLGETVLQVALCMRLWRLGRRQNALASTANIKAPDWRLAAQGWFERRLRKLEAVA